MEMKSTRQDRGGNRTQPFAEATEWSAACPFPGWLRRDKQGDLLYKAYCEGDGDLSSFSVDQCCCVPGKIVFRLRQPDQLSSTHTDRTESQKGNRFWCFVYVQAPTNGRKFQCTLPMLPSLGIVVNIQESFTRQNVFCGRTEGCFSKQTVVKRSVEYVACPC